MFERFYGWTMRHGSRVLFLLALVLFASTAILSALARLGDTGNATGFETSQSPASWLLSWAALFVTSFQMAVWPLLGAMVIDRLDRYRHDSK